MQKPKLTGWTPAERRARLDSNVVALSGFGASRYVSRDLVKR